MRVALADGQARVSLGSSTPAQVKTLQGQPLGQIPQGRSLTVTAQADTLRLADWQGQGFWVEPTAGGYICINDQWYRGRVWVTATAGKVTVVNSLDLETYLYGVLGGEMPSSWPQEALKAQAVAARSYALYQRQRHRSEPYDVDSTTAHQVYKGLGAEAPSTLAAVNATRGQVLTYGGQVIEAVFHASSGGQTENVENVWQRPVPYLRSVPDFDQQAPMFHWSQTFSLSQFAQHIPGLGQLLGVVDQRRSPQGRVMAMELRGSQASRTLTGTELRQALGLRSNLFTLTLQGNQVRVEGRGYGHGLGLSQWGARGLALQGYSYQQILSHYYQGTALAQVQVARRP
jgi:stage II sporulation protein D